MRALYIVTIFFISCSTSKPIGDSTEKVFIINPGKGTNQLNIGATKIASVFTILGKNDKVQKKKIDGIDSNFVIYSYVYANLGLTVISPAISEFKGEDLDRSFIANMYFSKTANAKTSNGIIMNKSSEEEVHKTFGKPDKQLEYADVIILHYHKDGISFLIEKGANKVTGIEVYKNNGFSSHL